MIPLRTDRPDLDGHIYDLVNRKLMQDASAYEGLNLLLGYTVARDFKQNTSVTWKVEAGATVGKARPRLKYLGRFRDVENDQTLSGLWYDIHTKSYEFWLKRQADKIK